MQLCCLCCVCCVSLQHNFKMTSSLFKKTPALGVLLSPSLITLKSWYVFSEISEPDFHLHSCNLPSINGCYDWCFAAVVFLKFDPCCSFKKSKSSWEVVIYQRTMCFFKTCWLHFVVTKNPQGIQPKHWQVDPDPCLLGQGQGRIWRRGGEVVVLSTRDLLRFPDFQDMAQCCSESSRNVHLMIFQHRWNVFAVYIYISYLIYTVLNIRPFNH